MKNFPLHRSPLIRTAIAATRSRSNSPSGAGDPPASNTGGQKADGAPTENKEILGNLLEEALELPPTTIEKPVKKIDKNTFDALVREIGNLYKCSPPAALLGLFSTLQAGGTSKNKRSNVKITVAGNSFESKEINKLIAKYCKDFTPRQFASYFRNDIFAISKKHEITGNAYVSLRRNYPDFITETSPDDKYWASDFQLDNELCPPLIRDGLRKRYNDKFTNIGKS
jgi:hypothetical protein